MVNMSKHSEGDSLRDNMGLKPRQQGYPLSPNLQLLWALCYAVAIASVPGQTAAVAAITSSYQIRPQNTRMDTGMPDHK